MPDQIRQHTSSVRRLAAIMFTDIVGYTALMGKDSQKALELVRKSKEIQKPLVEKHNGKWLKEMGDGAMAQFNTALDAVNCAIEIQEQARAKFNGKLRIGIHLGDITIENDDVYGDGVNIAARIESIADPGGIYVSDAIEKAIKGQMDIQAKHLGEVRLKNVAYGVNTYALQGVGLPVPDIGEEKQLSGRIIAELQRRGVIRVGISYLVLSLLMVLLFQYAMPFVNLPEWTFQTMIFILIAVFPIAIYLAWNYERSPDGFVKTSSQQSWQNPYTATERKPLTSNIIIVSMALIIAIMYIYPRYLSPSETNNGKSIEVNVDDKSIAVLPFANMSNDPDQEYFSDGMMDEILMHLFKIGDLEVTSRTSVMQYKGTTKTTPEIAKELGVAHVLEGSVQKAGERVRIIVQLIDAINDKHLWAESYSRDIKDVFDIQSEVAREVAKALKAEINPDARRIIDSKPTDNPEAYDLYLKARELNTYNEKENNEAIALINKAIELDPNFSSAYRNMGLRLTVGASYLSTSGGINPREAWQIAKPYYQKALEINPDDGIAHRFFAWSLIWYEWNFEAAEREYRETQRIFPNYSWTDYHLALGQFEEAYEGAIKNVEIDSRNSISWTGIITSAYFADRDPESTLRDALTKPIIRDNIWVRSEAARIYLYIKEYDQAISITKQIFKDFPDVDSPRLTSIQAISYFNTNRIDETNRIITELKQKSEVNAGGSPSFYIAMIYAQIGEIDLAFQWLEKAYQDHEVEMYWLKVEPPFEPLRTDPRYQEMLNKEGFPD
jgi:TolB-like protein/class 3 adenylate cyclase